MNTRCGSERQFGGQGVKRRSVLAGGVASTAGALMAPRITRAQSIERMRRIGWLSGASGVQVRPTFSEALRELGWINLSTAKSLGLVMPQALLLQADLVIP